MDIKILGPRDKSNLTRLVINTTSQSRESWSKCFSPFYLGPVSLYGGMTSQTMENAWQYAKVYASHVLDGRPSPEYWSWAKSGWASRSAARYPMGKGSKPLFSWWEGEALSYIEARKKVYFHLYRDALRDTAAFKKLKQLAATQPLALWDFDGYDHDAVGLSLAEVLNNDKRPMGHAFVIKAMLLFGENVTPEMLEQEAPPKSIVPTITQGSLF